MTATYNNASDGIVTPLMAYDATDVINPFAPTMPINLYNSYNSVKYLLSSINNNNVYSITSLDTSLGTNYRTINVTGNTLTITLYPIRIA